MIASRLFGETRERFKRRVDIGRCVVCGDLKANFLVALRHDRVVEAGSEDALSAQVYRWGSLMAGVVAGSLPLIILYAFFC